jgi:DNA-directed RNA polymerase subunit RPC12/RpoP
VFAEINRARETAMLEAAKYFDALAESKHTKRIPSNGDMVARALTFSISGHAPSKGKTARERADLTPSEPGYTVEPDCLIVAALRAQLLNAPKGSRLLFCTDNIKDFAVLDPESGAHVLHPDVVAEMPCEATFFRTLPELLESGLAGSALSQDAKELYADAVEEAVALTAQLTGVKTKESTVCPSCSAKVGVEIGVLPGSTAHPVCPVCGLGFFVHRSATGEVFVRRDGKARERRTPKVLCPQCGKRILLNLKDTDSGEVERFCFSCQSRLTIDSATGAVTGASEGEAIAATLVSVDGGRTVIECPLCERRLRTIGVAGPDEFAVCNSDSHPPQLLRVEVTIDNAPSEG